MVSGSRLNQLGIALAAVGTLLALYSYSGERVYDLTFLGLAIVGAVLIIAGVLVLAIVRASTDKAGRRADSLRTAPVEEKGPFEVTMQCPQCNAVFTRVGPRPMATTCPQCGARGSTG